MNHEDRHRLAQRTSWWSGNVVRVWALLVVLAAGRLAAADPILPAARILDPTDPRAKISSLIRPYLDLAPAAQGLDRRLRGMMVAASRPDVLKVRLDVPVTPATLADIAGTGAQVISSAPRWNSVLVEATMAQIDALARLPEVVLIAAALRPLHHGTVGTYSSQADAVLHTDTVRATYGVTGAGQVIGVISDSVNLTPANGAIFGSSQFASLPGGTVTGSNPGILTGTPQQNSGDLPAALAVFNLDLDNIGWTTPPPGQQVGTDEGEALLEVAYHIAPGASYAFSSAGNVETDFAASIQQLQAYGCTLICDDVGYPTEAMFQDGPVAQAASAFVAAGGIYCSSAGNSGNTGILTNFLQATSGSDPDTNGVPNGNHFTSWGSSGVGANASYLPIVIGPQTLLSVTLEWNQPYSSFNLGPGPATDLDLYIYAGTSTSSTIDAASIDPQTPGTANPGNPFEYLQFANPGNSSLTVYLAVNRFAGPLSNPSGPLVMRLLLDPGGGTVSCPSPSPNVLISATIQGHQSASAVLAIGAVDWNSPTQVENYTSFGGWGPAGPTGGMPFYFDTAGNLLNADGSPQLRNKPDLTATDGLYVADQDFDLTFPGPNPPGFYGTSCASPAATAAAALTWCVQPGLTNTQITANLTASATPITTSPTTSPDGWSGHGLVNASAAIGATVTGVVKVTSIPSSGTVANGTVSILVTFTSAVTVTGTPVLTLNTSPPRQAVYTSGSGTNTLTFTYTITAGDNVAVLDLSSSTALTLSGGTIHASPAISLILPQPGSPSSLGVESTLTVAAVPDPLAITATPATSNATAFTFTFTFTWPVTGFTAANITLTNATAGTFTAVSPTIYTLTVTATPVVGATTETVTASVAAGAVNDIYSYPNVAASGSALVDTVPPTLVITLAAPTVVTGGSDTATFTFSKAIPNFYFWDITVSGGTIGTLSGSGAVYTMPVTAGAVGTMTVGVTAAGVHDLAGNALVQPASVQATVTAAPASSSKHCGLGHIFGLLLLSGLIWLRRGQAEPRAG